MGTLWRWWRTMRVRWTNYSGVKVIHAVPFLPAPRGGRWRTLPDAFHSPGGKTEPAYAHVGPNLNQPPMLDYMGAYQVLQLELDIISPTPLDKGSFTYDEGKATGKYEIR
jgi:hypothetical protein